MTAVLGGLGPEGKLLIVGAPPEPLQVPAGLLIFGRRSVAGLALRPLDRLAGHDGLRGADRDAVPQRDLPLDRAAAAYDRMMSGQARFRVVLTMS